MNWYSMVVAAPIIGLLAFTAWTDVATRTIPDGIAIALAAFGLAIRVPAGLSAIVVSAALAGLLFLLLVLAHARGVMGGGDVKLAAAVALGLSPEALYRFIVVTAFAGGALGLLHLALRRAFRGKRTTPPPPDASVLRRMAAAERWRIARNGSLPYGVAIAFGGVWAVLSSPGG